MGKNCRKEIWLPCDLKARVKRLARSNGLTSSELIRLSIEAKLPEYEAGELPFGKSLKSTCRKIIPDKGLV